MGRRLCAYPSLCIEMFLYVRKGEMCIGVVALHMDPETIMTDHVCLGRLHPIKAEIKVNLLSGNVMPFLKD